MNKGDTVTAGPLKPAVFLMSAQSSTPVGLHTLIVKEQSELICMTILEQQKTEHT